MAVLAQVGQQNAAVPATAGQGLDHGHAGFDAKKLQRLARVALVVARLDGLRLGREHVAEPIVCGRFRGDFVALGRHLRLGDFLSFGLWRLGRPAGAQQDCQRSKKGDSGHCCIFQLVND